MSSISKTSRDARTEERIKTTGVVYYSEGFETYDPAKHATSYTGKAVDLSDRGACITTGHFFPNGTKIRVTFRDMKNLTAIATVRWCLETADGVYRVGLQLPKDVD
ncbi:MAG: hypothetical protein GWM98_18510 [Nitrospinaceae bacterium]|nr:hypothetical protein [Nitrospinaceae bacterium]